MSKRITIGSRSVAVAVLAEAIREALPGQYEAEILDGRGELAETLADRLVSIAWDVEYKARAEKLVITIDAGVSTPDAARSIPETQPMSAGDGSPDDLAATGAPCPNISNGEGCRYYAGHTGPHTFGGGLKDPVSLKPCTNLAVHDSHAWADSKTTYACKGRSGRVTAADPMAD